MKEMTVLAQEVLIGDHINYDDEGWDRIVKMVQEGNTVKLTLDETCTVAYFGCLDEIKVRRVTWQGETKCNFCKRETRDNPYDCKTLQGPWAVCCPIRWATHAYYSTLGQGKGQRYVNLIKVEG